MAKVAETYIALKISKLVKDKDDSDLQLAEELNTVIAETVESILTEAGETGLIVEVVDS